MDAQAEAPVQLAAPFGPDAWEAYISPDSGVEGALEWEQVEGSPTLSVAIEQPGQQIWKAGVVLPVAAEWQSGDVLTLAFHISPEPSTGDESATHMVVAVQRAEPPHTALVRTIIQAQERPQWVRLPISIPEDGPPAPWQIVFQFGDRIQQFKLSQVRLEKHPQGTDLATLETLRPPITYAGIEPDAEWREQARERIHQLRTGNLSVKAIGPDGAPVEGLGLKLRLTRHAFPFGTAVVPYRLVDPDFEVNERYRTELLANFNAAVTENALKWAFWAGDHGERFDRSLTMGGLNWLKRHGFETRGHVLFWPSWEHTPGEFTHDADGFPHALEQFIQKITTSTRGLIDEWDVVNEPFTHREITQAIGPQIIDNAFHWTRQNLPGTPLFINDFNILAAPPGDNEQRDFFHQLIGDLIERGVPVSGIGMQAHFGYDLTPPEALWAILDRFAELGLPIRITEFDVAIDDETAQAAYTRDFLLAAFAHPAVTGIFQWGFWEGAHWRPSAALFRRDWTPKPNLHAYRDLVFSEWHTELEGQTNAQGNFAGRAFFGRYTIEVTDPDWRLQSPADFHFGTTTGPVILQLLNR